MADSSHGLYGRELVRDFTTECGDRSITAVVKLSGMGLHHNFDHFEERFSKVCDLIDVEAAASPKLGLHEGGAELKLGRHIQIDAGEDAEVVIACSVTIDLPESVAREVVETILQSFSAAVMIELVGLEVHTIATSFVLNLSEG